MQKQPANSSITIQESTIASLDNELESRISSFRSGSNYDFQKTSAMVIHTEKYHDAAGQITSMFREKLNNSGSIWNIVELSGRKGLLNLPEIMNYFKRGSIVTGAIYAGIFAGRKVKLVFNLIVSLICAAGAFVWITGQSHDDFFSIISKHPIMASIILCGIVFYFGYILITSYENRDNAILASLGDAISKNNPDTMKKLYLYFTDVVLGVLDRPLAIIVKDFSSLDPFTRELLFNVMAPPEKAYFGSLLWCICDSSPESQLIKRLQHDTHFSERAMGGTCTIIEMKDTSNQN